MRYFQYEHLPPHLQEASKPFCELAKIVCDPTADDANCFPRTIEAVGKLKANDEQEFAEGIGKLFEAAEHDDQDSVLRKLLEAKDCIVRAMLVLLVGLTVCFATGCSELEMRRNADGSTVIIARGTGERYVPASAAEPGGSLTDSAHPLAPAARFWSGGLWSDAWRELRERTAEAHRKAMAKAAVRTNAEASFAEVGDQ